MHARLPRSRTAAPSGGQAHRGPARALAAATLLLATACGGTTGQLDALDGVPDAEATAVRVAASEQLQIGYRIRSTAGRDDALQLCHEFCRDATRSDALATEICRAAAKYPNVLALQSKCRAARGRATEHRAGVPRQCMCQQD